MAAQIILSDENCTGHAEAIFFVLIALGYVELLNLELRTWKEVGLEEGTNMKLSGSSVKQTVICYLPATERQKMEFCPWKW